MNMESRIREETQGSHNERCRMAFLRPVRVCVNDREGSQKPFEFSKYLLSPERVPALMELALKWGRQEQLEHYVGHVIC